MNPTISIEGDAFALTIPGSHTVHIPLDRPDQLVTVLMARQRGAIRIAEPGSPTQWAIDRPREAEDIKRFSAAQREADLAELGL